MIPQNPNAAQMLDALTTLDPTPPKPRKKTNAPTADELWAPALAPTQQKIFDDPAKYILAYGERFSGKTWGVLHKIVRHCWEHRDALALVIVGVRRQATAGGSWHKLLTDVLPTWKKNLEGFDHSEQKFTPEKDMFVWVSNQYGGWSSIQLISIPHGANLAARVRGIEASLIFVDELVGIGGTEYFEALIQQVGRRPHIPSEAQQYLAATNPDGPSHWVYKRFFVHPRDVATGAVDPAYSTHHVPISENPDPKAAEYYKTVMEATANDPVERARMIEGKWVDRPSGEAIFRNYFLPDLHVKGSVAEGTGLTPRPGTTITLGYDLGDRNHAIIFMQERQTSKGPLWMVFDELVRTDQDVSFDMLVPELLRKMNFWCEEMGHDFNFWHVSDRSAFDRFRAATGSYDHRQIEQLSRDALLKSPGRYAHLKKPIRLVECPKPPGSVAARVKTVIQLLQREELAISALCPRTIEMMKYLESERDEPFSPRRSQHLHPFDALSYPLFLNVMGGAAVSVQAVVIPQVTQASLTGA